MIGSDRHGAVAVVTIHRQERRNAVDPATASALLETVTHLDAADDVAVIVITGDGGTFCAGADLTVMASGATSDQRIEDVPPLGVTRYQSSRPTIAAVEGHAMGGGFELALGCDLRVAGRDAQFAMAHRRWGLPTADGGSVRLPRMVGQGHALDLILTRRRIDGAEAERIGLVDRLVPTGTALEAALDLAQHIATLPQHGLRHDRLSVIEQWSLPYPAALENEAKHAADIVAEFDPAAITKWAR